MEEIKAVQNHLDALKEEIHKIFPDYTSASFVVNADGYLSISVTKWDENGREPVEERKRRELLDRCKVNGEWSTDRSDSQNGYYDSIGVLLKED